MKLTTYKSQKESCRDIAKFMHCFTNDFTVLEARMNFNVNGNGWYSLDSLSNTCLSDYFYNDLKYLCDKQNIDLNEYYIYFSVGCLKTQNTKGYLGICQPGETHTYDKNEIEIKIHCDIQITTYYNNSSNIVIIGTEENWEMNENIDCIYISLPKMNTAYIGKVHGFYYANGDDTYQDDIDELGFNPDLNLHFIEYNLFLKPRIDKENNCLSHYESLSKCIKDNNVVEELQKRQHFKYCYGENDNSNNIIRELFDNKYIGDYQEVNCETLSCSESELIMQHFHDCDYDFDKLKNDIFLEDYVNRNDIILYGTSTSTFLITRIVNIMIEKNIQTIKLVK